MMCGRSRALIEVLESDACNANMSLIAERLRELDLAAANGRLFDAVLSILCGVHQGNLVSMLGLQSLDGTSLPLLNDLFCASCVARQPGFWSRILSKVKSVLDDRETGLRIAPDQAPPKGAREENEEFLRTCGLDPSDEDLQELLSLLTERWSSELLIHHCRCKTRCVLSRLTERVAILIERIVFGRSPDLPIPARWFRCLSTFNWFRLLAGIQGIGKKVMSRALDKRFVTEQLRKASVEARDAPAANVAASDIAQPEDHHAAAAAAPAAAPEADPSADPAADPEENEIECHEDHHAAPEAAPAAAPAAVQPSASNPADKKEADELTAVSATYRDHGFDSNVSRAAFQRELGMRTGRTLHVLQDPRTNYKLDCTVITSAAVNWFIAWHLEISKQRNEKRWDDNLPSPLLDLLNPEMSPTTVAQQWLSALVCQPATASSVRFVTGLIHQDGSIDGEILAPVMRLSLLNSSSLESRIQEPLEEDHYQAMSTSDPRLPAELVASRSDNWAAMRGCCRNPYVGAPLSRLVAFLETGDTFGVVSAAGLQRPEVKRQNATVCKVADMNTVDLELIHARNKRDSEDAESGEMLISRCQLRESVAMKQRATRPSSDQSIPLELADVPGDDESISSKRYRGKKMLHTERLHIRSICWPHENNNPCNDERWKETNLIWDEMPAATQQLYKDAATASNAAGYNLLLTGSTPEHALMDLDDNSATAADTETSALLAIANVPHNSQDDEDSISLPNPVPHLIHRPEPAGDLAWPVSLAALSAPETSLKDNATKWTERVRPITDGAAFAKYTVRKSCVKKGACYPDWRRQTFPIWKREKALQNVHRFVQSRPVPLWLKGMPRPHSLSMIMLHGRNADTPIVHRCFLIGAYTLSPIQYELLEYVWPFGAELRFPYTLTPETSPHVKSKLKLPLGAQHLDGLGALRWQRFRTLITRILLHSEGMPVTDESCKWYITSVQWSWTCLTIPTEPLANVTISGVDSASWTWIDGPRPRARLPRAPKATHGVKKCGKAAAKLAKAVGKSKAKAKRPRAAKPAALALPPAISPPPPPPPAPPAPPLVPPVPPPAKAGPAPQLLAPKAISCPGPPPKTLIDPPVGLDELESSDAHYSPDPTLYSPTSPGSPPSPHSPPPLPPPVEVAPPMTGPHVPPPAKADPSRPMTGPEEAARDLVDMFRGCEVLHTPGKMSGPPAPPPSQSPGPPVPPAHPTPAPLEPQPPPVKAPSSISLLDDDDLGDDLALHMVGGWHMPDRSEPGLYPGAPLHDLIGDSDMGDDIALYMSGSVPCASALPSDPPSPIADGDGHVTVDAGSATALPAPNGSEEPGGGGDGHGPDVDDADDGDDGFATDHEWRAEPEDGPDHDLLAEMSANASGLESTLVRCHEVSEMEVSQLPSDIVIPDDVAKPVVAPPPDSAGLDRVTRVYVQPGGADAQAITMEFEGTTVIGHLQANKGMSKCTCSALCRVDHSFLLALVLIRTNGELVAIRKQARR